MSRPAEVVLERSRPIGRWTLYILPVLLTVVAGLMINAAYTVDPRGCQDPTQAYLPDRGLLLLGAGALLVGRVLGYERYRRDWQGWQIHKAAVVTGGLGLLLLFLGATFALGYEAVGVDLAGGYANASLEPITYYVRCAIFNDKHGSGGLLTAAVVVLSSGLVGHWLWAWHPRERFETNGVSDGNV